MYRNIILKSNGFSLIEIMVSLGILSISLAGLAQLLDLSSKVDSTSRARVEAEEFSKALSSLVQDDQFCTRNLSGKNFDVSNLGTKKDFTYNFKNINPDDSLGSIIFENNITLSSTLKVTDVKYLFDISKGGGKYFGKLLINYKTSRAVVGPSDMPREVSFYIKVDSSSNLVECGQGVLSPNKSMSKVYDGNGIELGDYLGYDANTSSGIYQNSSGASYSFQIEINGGFGSFYTSVDCTGQPYTLISYQDRFHHDIDGYPLLPQSPEFVHFDSFSHFQNGIWKCSPTNSNANGNYIKAITGGNRLPCGIKKCEIK